jgi:glycerol-3-phosphate O-acyltransferase
VARALALKTGGRWHRYGYASVSFGAPVSLRAYARERGLNFRKLAEEKRFAEIEGLGRTLMADVAKVVPVLPVSLVATLFIRAEGRALSEIEVKSGTVALIDRLRTKGVHVHVPRQDRDYAVSAGLRMLTLRRLVEERDGLYTANPRESVLLRYYANSIAHHFAGDPAASD